MDRLKGKVAVITGGAMGIGGAASRLFAAEGATVIVADIQEEAGQRTVDEIRAAGGSAELQRLDVSDEDQVREAMETVFKNHGRLDVLVNNAGITGTRKPTHEITEEEWDRVMAINVKGVFFSTKHAVPCMKRSGGGSIVNVASFLGVVATAGVPPYTASKAAVRYMTRTDALIYAPDNIRVNCVNPGYVWTPLIEGYLKTTGDPEGGRKRLERLHPLGRLGTPEDVAYAILYLASDESGFVTGSDLAIDGGLTAQ